MISLDNYRLHLQNLPTWLMCERIRDNNFTGKIPNFISQWKQIRKL
ncbi:hypothetical protein HanRHA438_Chr17g0835321 [Helianthus annuus]|nr:hypothetical protein HanRHA438_Chr17g0835321 [Helianthus annuus]